MSDASPPDPAPPAWGDGPYSIVRHGQTLATCESEPVQAPGCIQSHGALLVLRITDFTILQASENTAAFLLTAPETLLGKPVSSVIGAANEQRLREILEHESIESSTKYAFTLPASTAVSALDVCVHTQSGVMILEFENTERRTSGVTSNEEYDYFDLIKSAVCRIQATNNLKSFCHQVAEEVRRLTGLDRTMVYRFHADHHGEVFAEAKRADMAPLLGLHYPEADIPKQARDIFTRIWIRPVPNAAAPLVEMVPLANPDTGRPLNMTHCALRGTSVMYTEYLANMGVAASLAMSILIDGELWGLVVGHHNTPTQFPHRIRTACEFLAQVVSLQLKSVEQREQLAYRLKLEEVHQKLVSKAAQAGDLMALSDNEPSLLDALDAGGAALFHLDRWWCSGKTPATHQLDLLADWLNHRPEFESTTRPVFVTDQLSAIFPDAKEFADVGSGLLAVRVSRRTRDLILWFRPETAQTVNWAGDPNTKLAVTGPNGPRLTPRGSFDLFIETVKERAMPWSEMEIDSALRLRMLVMELVVSRAERLTELNADLTRSNDELDAFAYVASHDLKEPLRGIHKYAHQLLESAKFLDTVNHKRVENLMRLTVRMDSLLDSLLHFSRVGRSALELETVDLNDVIQEALEMIGARRSDCALQVTTPRPFPHWRCDRIRIREVYTNLLSNAIKYAGTNAPQVELGFLRPDENGLRPNAPVSSSKQTVFYVSDNGIGIEPRHFEHVFRIFKRLHGRDEFGGGVGAGLTIVQKHVQRHGGCVWVDSKPAVGSTFFFTMPCGEEDASC